MGYDPIQRAIEIQLSSAGHPHNPENLIIKMIDLVHSWRVVQAYNVIALRAEGYTIDEIHNKTGINLKKINRIVSHFSKNHSQYLYVDTCLSGFNQESSTSPDETGE